ncbi:MAG: HlyD family secretion protein [Aulosira sp. DedQUE10]|nr:HlyD family secretion protein [Aulosira sp. DedQUE10]
MSNHADSNSLPTFQINEFLPPLSRWVRFGGLLLLGSMGIAIAFAATAQYRITVKAPAIIRPMQATTKNLVPKAATPIIKAFVAAEDINQVAVKQKAQLRISACPYPDYGTLTGVVRTISPDAQTLSATGGFQTVQIPGEMSFYEVTVEPENLVLQQGNRQCRIQVGMQGRIDIISREETVLRFLLRKVRLIVDL